MRRKLLISISILVLFSVPIFNSIKEVRADSSVTAYDMISLVNSWRTGTYGYSALVENLALDSCAQWTADQMAAIGADTHLSYKGYSSASSRCAGFGYTGSFVTENFAYDSEMTIEKLATYWADASHQLPASDSQYVNVGVGISGTYYVLQAGSAETGQSSSSSSASNNTSSTSAVTIDYSDWITPIITSTPNEDGAIYHVVQYGQALSSISEYYDVSIDQIKTLNAITSDDIKVGDIFLIRLAPTVTITPSRTPTVMMPTRTPTQTAMPSTPRPTRTTTPTPRAGLAQSLPKLDRQWLGFGLLIVSAAGLFMVLYFSFIKPMRKK